MKSNLKLADVSILTAQQIADFNRDGFLIVPGMFSRCEMVDIIAWTDEVQNFPEIASMYMMYFEQSLIDPGKRVLQRIENFHPYHSRFADLFDGENLCGAVGELFGEAAVLFKEKINFKLPGGDGFKPHQDQQAGWGTYADLFVRALVSVDEANLDNGCMELASWQHKRGLVGGEWTPLTDENMQDMDFKPVPTRPGDVIFFDSFAPHGSGPNLSDKQRRVLYVTYNRCSEGDHRIRYYADKRQSYPPDIERDPNKEYKFRV